MACVIAEGKGVSRVLNPITASHQKIADAIDEAIDELYQVQRQLKQLHMLEQRAKQLEEFITLGKSLIGQEIADRSIESQDREARDSRTVKDTVRALFEEKKHPMRMYELANELIAREWVVGKWAREVIRTAVRRHQEDFERIAGGVYALKEWPEVLKRWPRSETHPLYEITTSDQSPQNGSGGEIMDHPSDQSENLADGPHDFSK